jgi:hypothetical protein
MWLLKLFVLWFPSLKESFPIPVSKVLKYYIWMFRSFVSKKFCIKENLGKTIELIVNKKIKQKTPKSESQEKSIFTASCNSTQ